MRYSIGEFSRITGLTIKALRLYHDRGLLLPVVVDSESGYRYYDPQCLEKARTILMLRDMMFSLDEIMEILRDCEDEAEILVLLQEKKDAIAARMKDFSRISRSLTEIIHREKEVSEMLKGSQFEVEEKEIASVLVASIRWKGPYEECGKRFSQLFKAMGRFVCGKPLCLYYDEGVREGDADIESCVPIRKGKEREGITVRMLEGGRFVSLLHKGPYSALGRSYERIIDYMKEKGHEVEAPCRELYHKGPGMIFKGNPKNYLTEILFQIKEEA